MPAKIPKPTLTSSEDGLPSACYLTIAEVTAIHKTGREQVHRWIRSGKLEAIRVDKFVCVRPAALADFEQRHATWVAEIQWTDHNGTHRRRKKRTTRTAAVAARDALVNDIRDGRVSTGDASRTTVAEAFARYLAEAETRVRPRTFRDDRRWITTLIIPVIGRFRAQAVRRPDIVRMPVNVRGSRSKQIAYVLAKAAIGPYVRAVDPMEHPFPPRSTPRTTRPDRSGF